MTCLPYVSQFLRQQRTQKADATLRNYARTLKRLDDWLSAREIAFAEVRPLDLAEHVAELREHHPADSVNQTVSAARVYFRWLCELELRADNPAAHLHFLPPDHKPVESLTPEEVRALLGFAARNGNRRFGTCRAAFLVVLLIDTGLRLGEALRLRLPDVDLIENRLLVTATKTNSIRFVPVSPYLRRHLIAYLRRRAEHIRHHHLPDIGLLFVAEDGGEWSERSAQRGSQTVGRGAGLTRRFHPHLLRHTFATLSLMGGAPLPAVMALGGWRKLATVQRYTVMSQRQLADAQAASSPLAQAGRLRFVIPDEEATDG